MISFKKIIASCKRVFLFPVEVQATPSGPANNWRSSRTVSGYQGRRRVHLTLYLGDLARTPCNFQIKEILEVQPKLTLAGQNYWATPGGALEAGESFADAACRELFEETGIRRDAVGQEVAEREFVLQLHDGEYVTAEERFFLIRVADQSLSRNHWTPIEIEVMADHRWWSVEELASTREVVFPETLVTILASIEQADTLAP